MKRIIECDCVKKSDGNLVPLWELDWKIDDDDISGEYGRDDLNSFIECAADDVVFWSDSDIIKGCLYDLVKKKVVPTGRVIKLLEYDETYKPGDDILVRCQGSLHEVVPAKIKDIIKDEDNEVYYVDNEHLQENWLRYYVGTDYRLLEDTSNGEGNINITKIIVYKPRYILEDGSQYNRNHNFLKIRKR